MTINLLTLYNGIRRDTGKASMHTHPFWQLEIATDDPIPYTWNDISHIMHPGEMLLIPPYTEHEFVYDRPGIVWITMKFERQGEDARPWGGVINNSLFTAKFTSSLKSMIASMTLRPYEKRFVEGLVESLFVYVHDEHSPQAEDDSVRFVRTIAEWVRERNGKPVSINQLAKHLSYTRTYLSKQYKLHTGESLKSFIDRQRLEKAKEMLRYSEFHISAISEELGFKDIFSFSRFFKRISGVSPREFRGKK